MNDKYYTPNIEEFHVGFEYEYWNNTTDKWCSTVLGNGPISLFFADYLGIDEPDKYRVKYLDRKDIESLNFKYIKTQPGLNEDFFEYIKQSNEYYLEFDYDTKYLRIYFSLEEGDSTIFAGIIKNLSELKKLMKQLNIL